MSQFGPHNDAWRAGFNAAQRRMAQAIRAQKAQPKSADWLLSELDDEALNDVLEFITSFDSTTPESEFQKELGRSNAEEGEEE